VLDRREQLALLPLGDPQAAGLLAPIPEAARGECWWLVLCDGTPVAGDRGGGVAVLEVLALTRAAGRLLHALRAGGAVDAVDRLFAAQRGRLGRLVPDGPAPVRYP
jgi:hypothetical protein